MGGAGERQGITKEGLANEAPSQDDSNVYSRSSSEADAQSLLSTETLKSVTFRSFGNKIERIIECLSIEQMDQGHQIFLSDIHRGATEFEIRFRLPGDKSGSLGVYDRISKTDEGYTELVHMFRENKLSFECQDDPSPQDDSLESSEYIK